MTSPRTMAKVFVWSQGPLWTAIIHGCLISFGKPVYTLTVPTHEAHIPMDEWKTTSTAARMQACDLGSSNHICPWELAVEVLHEASGSIITQEMVSIRHDRAEPDSSGAASGIQPGMTGAEWCVFAIMALAGVLGSSHCYVVSDCMVS